MPSKNSVNHPKLNLNKQRHSQSLGNRKRGANSGAISKASKDRYQTSSTHIDVGSAKSKVLQVYTGSKPAGGSVTTTTLSNKRAKKIERNKKYAKARHLNNDQLLVDLQAKDEMDLDDDVVVNTKTAEKSKDILVREALWNVIEDAAAGSFVMNVSGEGTTLGGPVF